MKWEEIHNYTISSAFEFLDSNLITLLLKNCENPPKTQDSFEIVDWLIFEYGSDYDVIKAVLEKEFSSQKYFWLLNFIEDGKRQEEHYRIRVWELNNSKEDEGENSDLLKGEDIDRFYAIGSMYNNGSIGVESKKNFYRLRVEELNKIKQLIRFKVDLAFESGDRRRTNNYLEIIEG